MTFDTVTMKEKYLNAVKEAWLTTEDSFPQFLFEVSLETKTINEKYLINSQSKLQEPMSRIPKMPWKRKRWKQNLLKLVEEILYQETIINIHSTMKPQELTLFQEELMEFMRQVRRFSPELNFEEIGQALRNYIVYAMFKKIHQDDSGFSKAAFGYSMLYPFTDNFIDNSANTSKDKYEYNQMIRSKLKGNTVNPLTKHQKKTCDLLDFILTDFPRDTTPMAADLLLMMLDAQEISISQQHRTAPLSGKDRLDVSLYKGGISVLIDRYFVNKELTEADIIFYLGLGFFLQLADDLQDIRDDSDQGYQTLFTLDLRHEKEEKLVNRMLHFIHNNMLSYQAENDCFKNFVLSNCYQLIYISAIRSKEFFSVKYLNLLEALLPVSMSYYDSFRSEMKMNLDVENSNSNKYMKLLDEIVFP